MAQCVFPRFASNSHPELEDSAALERKLMRRCAPDAKLGETAQTLVIATTYPNCRRPRQLLECRASLQTADRVYRAPIVGRSGRAGIPLTRGGGAPIPALAAWRRLVVVSLWSTVT